MSFLRSLPLIALVSVLLPSSQAPSFQGDRTCGDFLEKWGKKPTELRFTDCEKVAHPQMDRLVAAYVVQGTSADDVETYLQQEFNMTALRFICCGWESVNIDDLTRPSAGLYRDRFGNQFEIKMFSAETLIQEREQWNNIPEFHVWVTTYLGTP